MNFSLNSFNIVNSFDLSGQIQIATEGFDCRDINGDGTIDNMLIKLNRIPTRLPSLLFYINPFQNNDTLFALSKNMTLENSYLNINFTKFFQDTGKTSFKTGYFGIFEDFQFLYSDL